MPKAILIGFEYIKTNKRLTGALIDIYLAYRWCRSFNCDIDIITDIMGEIDESLLKEAIDRDIVDKDILKFGRFKYVGETKKQVIEMCNIILNKNKYDDNKLIIYYTGHGVKDAMVLPNDETLMFIEFRDMILDNIDAYCEVFWIADCCNPNGLYLPYKLRDDGLRLSNTRISFVTQPIILITSADDNEKSISTKYGSAFTVELFRLLNAMNILNDSYNSHQNKRITDDNNRNLIRLQSNISSQIKNKHRGYSQTISIYSSYFIEPILWMWVGSKNIYDIVTDSSLTVLVVRPKI